MLRILIRDWTKTDYAIFAALTWVIVFVFVVLTRLVEGRNPDWLFASAFSFVMIPIEIAALYLVQKYSSNTTDLYPYSVLQPEDFKDNKLQRNGNNVIFFYTEWCPYWRKSIRHLKSFDQTHVKVFRVDLSDENNPLWESLKIKIVPTLIVFKDGTEFWRANGISMIGLRKKDFTQAITETN